jgi:hypothetical protein
MRQGWVHGWWISMGQGWVCGWWISMGRHQMHAMLPHECQARTLPVLYVQGRFSSGLSIPRLQVWLAC